MKTVRATNASKETGITIRELGRVAEPGELFEVEDARVKELTGNNAYGKVFVLEEVEVVEKKTETPKKKSASKK